MMHDLLVKLILSVGRNSTLDIFIGFLPCSMLKVLSTYLRLYFSKKAER